MQEQSSPCNLTSRCRALEVSRSGYDDWFTRPPSAQTQKDQVLSERSVEPFAANRRVYGTRRLKACFADAGAPVSRRRMGRLLAELKRKVSTRRPLKATTDAGHGPAVAPHLRTRQCAVAEPDTAYVGDMPSLWTSEGWLSLAVGLDGFSRAVVGWSMRPALKAELVTNALEMALDRRQPPPGLIMPTDRGSHVADRY